jgi:hypothetical protein
LKSIHLEFRDKLSGAAVAAIVLACIFASVILAVGIGYILWRRKRVYYEPIGYHLR